MFFRFAIVIVAPLKSYLEDVRLDRRPPRVSPIRQLAKGIAGFALRRYPTRLSRAKIKITATRVLFSVEECLRTGYRPDCDYLDGEIVERNLGEFEHSRTLREILFFLGARYPRLREQLLPEQRVQVRADRYRIPDVCIVTADALGQKIVTTPPELCIEILSPGDTLARTMDRVRDYFHMGVPACWIIDPGSGQGWWQRQGAWKSHPTASFGRMPLKCRSGKY